MQSIIHNNTALDRAFSAINSSVGADLDKVVSDIEQHGRIEKKATANTHAVVVNHRSKAVHKAAAGKLQIRHAVSR